MTPLPVEALSTALAVLTAMITPAVLISACGTLMMELGEHHARPSSSRSGAPGRRSAAAPRPQR